MKPNYYTIHKNKKPKRLRRGKADPFTAATIATAIISAAQINAIQSQFIPSFKEESVYNSLMFNQVKPPLKRELLSTEAVKLLESNGFDIEELTPKQIKELKLFDTVLSTAKAITVDIPKEKMLHKFKTTKRYVR